MENIKSKLWGLLRRVLNAPGFMLFVLGGGVYLIGLMIFGSKAKLYEAYGKLMALSMQPEKLKPIVEYTYYASTVIWAYVIINYYIF